MSFVNLMASDLWTEADIVRRTEAMIASEFSPEAEAILNRKSTGQALGMYVLSPEEQAELARYSEVAEAARLEGVAARADMALLVRTLPVEEAFLRLERPEVEPVLDDDGAITNQAEIDADQAERAEAQTVIDAADAEVLALIVLRGRIAEQDTRPEEEPEIPAQ